MANKQYVCINNYGLEISLTKYKMYEAIDEEYNHIRVVDDTDDDYLFSKERFVEPLEILHECSSTINEQIERITSEDYSNDPDINAINVLKAEWLKEKLEEHWLPNMPNPFIFPMHSDHILAMEWYIGYEEHGITIDFNEYTGDWDWWDSKKDESGEELLDLNLDESWDKIKKRSIGIRP